MAEADLSKIVNLIMENPKLIEEIRSIASKSEESAESAEPIEKSTEVTESSIAPTPIHKEEEHTYSTSKSHRRSELLRALRPYLSKERGKAIESMITVADILLTVKES